MPVLRVDAQFTVIEAALKGYMKWRASTTQQSLPDYVGEGVSDIGINAKLLVGATACCIREGFGVVVHQTSRDEVRGSSDSKESFTAVGRLLNNCT